MQFRVVALSLLSPALITGISLAQRAEPIAIIESPSPGQSVTTSDHVTIKMNGPGVPIVAVRSKQGGKWWIQAAAASDDSRTFLVPVRFGNDQTRPGTRFMITALIAADSQSAAAFKPGSQLDRLPDQPARAGVIEVVVGRNDTNRQQRPLEVELISPVAGGTSKWIQHVSLRLKETTARVPRLVVRSAEENAAWWVQESLQPSGESEFSGVVRVGNAETPPGSTFLLMLVHPEDEESLAALKTGAVLKDLAGFRCSEPFSSLWVSLLATSSNFSSSASK